MLQLLPVIEDGSPTDWAPQAETGGWIVLSGETSDRQIARAIATIAGYSAHIGVRDPLATTTKAIAATEQFVVGGGLIFRLGDFEAAPACCCGLEGWREWEWVKKGGDSPWLGHDPMAWIDCSGDEAVFWSDENGESVSLAYDQILAALAVAAADLEAFVERLRAWGANHGGDPRLAGGRGRRGPIADRLRQDRGVRNPCDRGRRSGSARSAGADPVPDP
jgi:hypothetical protein